MQDDQSYKTNMRVLAEIRCDEALDLLDAGKFAPATKLFRDCLAVDPTMVDAMHGLIRALQSSGQVDDAIRIAQRLVVLDPDDLLAHNSLSLLYQNKGMVSEAEAEAARTRVLDWQQGPKPNMDL